MTEHARGGGEYHPERPSRIRTIHEYLTQSGLLSQMRTIESRYATFDEISLAHDPALVKQVLAFENSSELEDEITKKKKILFPFDSDTYICHSSAKSAKLACGSVLSMIDEIMTNGGRRGFACIRPPGHHATYSTSMGFCLFNNVAIAAQYARKNHGIDRIAILDWDVHHGNGTNDIFSKDSNTLFMSIHRHDRGKFYPGSGDWTDIGSGNGRGYTINMPIDGSYGDEEMFYCFSNVVLPAIREFKPELVLVSAGFDAAENDPLGMCRVRCGTYGILTRMLIEQLQSTENFEISKGRILLVLEGGYNLKSIGNACVACVESLLETAGIFGSSPSLTAISSPSSTSSASTGASSIRSIPGGVPKSSTVKMVNKLTELLATTEGGLRIPIAPPLHPYATRKDKVAKKTPTAPVLKDEKFILVSGGGHAGAITRFDDRYVIKQTTVREAIAYILISEAVGGRAVEVIGDIEGLIGLEKNRLKFDENIDSFKELGKYTPRCIRVVFMSHSAAAVVIEDLTCDFQVDENLRVLDIKIGTDYHTPDDSDEKKSARIQKALSTSASELGIRIVACKCMDGFVVGKKKANRLKKIEQMVPLVRRFLYSDIEAFEQMLNTMETFVERLEESFTRIDINLIAASLLFVIGKSSDGKVDLKCRLIDLAHLFPQVGRPPTSGFLKGCRNLSDLVRFAKEPSVS